VCRSCGRPWLLSRILRVKFETAAACDSKMAASLQVTSGEGHWAIEAHSRVPQLDTSWDHLRIQGSICQGRQ
jgi:hypothetical protein